MIIGMVKSNLLPDIFHNISIQQILKKLNNPRFWRDSGLLIFANVIVTLLGLIRTPAMTWLLPKEEYGMLGAISAWMPFLQLLSLSGMDSATYHYVAKKLPWAFFTNISIRLRWSLLSSLGFIGLSIYWHFHGQANYALLFLITGLSYPLTTGLTVTPNIFSAQEDFNKLFYYRIFESLVDFTGFIPLALSGWIFSRIVSFYTANQLATIVMQVAYCAWVASALRRNTPDSLPTKEENQELIRYGKHLTLISGISVVQARTDALFVSALLPLETMADYSIGILVSEQFKRLWQIYTSIRYPPLVRMQTERRIKRIWLEGLVIIAGFIGVFICVVILSHIFIPIILPANYSNSIVLIDLLSFSFIAGLPGMIIEIYFRTEQKPKQQYYLRISAAIVNMIIPYLLILKMGVQGAALGKIIANATMSITGIILFIIETKHVLSKS
jgi:O-antigen/teichoic acid export membrane protein